MRSARIYNVGQNLNKGVSLGVKILLAYFGTGLLYDFLVTRFYIAIQKRETLMSGFMSLLLTTLSFMVLYHLVLGGDALWRTLAYASGCGVGTMICLEYRKWKARRC